MSDAGACYRDNGYWIEEDVLQSADVEELRTEIIALLRGERGDIDGRLENAATLSDQDLMLQSVGIYQAHKISDISRKHIFNDRVVGLLTKLVSPNVKCVQSMVFMKGPGKPGQAWHQDEVPLPTRDQSLIGIWIAIDDATIENGCVWVHPGSHQPGLLYEREPHQDKRFDGVPESQHVPYDDNDAVPVEMKAGSILFFSGYLLHRSLNNRTRDRFRRALVYHCMSAETWFPHSGTDDYRDFIMVAGEDPYAWKETVDERGAAIRGG